MNATDIRTMIVETAQEERWDKVGMVGGTIYYVAGLRQWIILNNYDESQIFASGSLEHCLECLDDQIVRDWYDNYTLGLEYY
jgi:hypothetical protein